VVHGGPSHSRSEVDGFVTAAKACNFVIGAHIDAALCLLTPSKALQSGRFCDSTGGIGSAEWTVL